MGKIKNKKTKEEKQETVKGVSSRTPNKVFGEYVAVKVIANKDEDAKTRIVVSVNSYNLEFQPRTRVLIPIKIAEFLEKLRYPEYFYDEEKTNGRGEKGVHSTRSVPVYDVIYVK